MFNKRDISIKTKKNKLGFPAPYIPLHDSYILIKNHIQKASNGKKLKQQKIYLYLKNLNVILRLESLSKAYGA